MLEVRGIYVYRGGEKIGWAYNNSVYDHTGKKLGYFTNDTVYAINGERMAHIDGNHVYFGGKSMELDDLIDHIAAVDLSDSARLAVITFLGE